MMAAAMARTFLLLGSGEFEPWVAETELEALGGATGDGTVIVLPTASATEGDQAFDRWAAMGSDHYRSMGVRADVLPVKVRDDAQREDLAARAEAASMIFFSGGKPHHLAEVLDGTPLWTSILTALDRGAVYAGCSAGAMVASQVQTERAVRHGTGSGWLFGLGLVPGVSFGVHWDRTRWIPGMRPFTTSRLAPGVWFVGIDERTAILGDGSAWEVHGRGGVSVHQGGDGQVYRSGQRFVAGDADRAPENR
jgi:cyanophycinase